MIKKWVVLFYILIIPIMISAQVQIGETSTTSSGVVINIPEPPPFNNTTGAVNSSDYWDNLDTPEDIDLNDLGDVSAIGPTNGTILSFNSIGGNWIAQTFAALNTIWQRNGNSISPINAGDTLNIDGYLSVQDIKLTNKSINEIWEGNLNIETGNSSENNLLFLIQHQTDGTQHFWLQEGGAGQASGITRSFMIVNENASLQNTTNITDCAANGVVNIDCNTTSTGADLFVGDDLEVGGDVWLKDETGEWKFLTRTLEIIDDLFENTVLNKLNATLVGNNLTIITQEGDSLKVNIADRETIFDRTTDSILLNLGTNSSPQFNIVSYQNASNPTLVVGNSVPSVPHAMVARGLVGDAEVYGAVLGLEGSSDEFINAVYDRFFDTGALYISGFSPIINSTNANFSDGEFTAILNDKIESESFSTSIDGYYFILANDTFIQSNDFSDIDDYATGESISNNKYFNVVIGLVQRTQAKSRLIVIISDKPGSEYVNLQDAEVDQFDSLNVRPSNDFLNKIYIPLVRVVIKKAGSGNTIQTLSNGQKFSDLRGAVTGIGGSPPTPSITDHDDLNNLEFNDSGHTFTSPGQVLNIGSYNFTTTGNATIGEKLIFALGAFMDNVVDGWLRVNGNLNITQNLTVTGEGIFQDTINLISGVPTIIFDDTHIGHDKYRIRIDEDILKIGGGSPTVDLITLQTDGVNNINLLGDTHLNGSFFTNGTVGNSTHRYTWEELNATGGGGEPSGTWLNNSAEVFLNSSFPQNVNISGNISMNTSVIFNNGSALIIQG